jgi:hypothetical protein
MSLSSHQNVTCSRYDTAEKGLHRAKGDMTITSILLFQVLNMQKFRIWDAFRPLFEIK